jgi:hypothetical protein
MQPWTEAYADIFVGLAIIAAVAVGQLSKQDRATLAKEAQDVMDGAQEIRDAVEPPYADVTPIGGAA